MATTRDPDTARETGEKPEAAEKPDYPKPLCVRVMQAARMLAIGTSRLYELIQSGDIEVVKLGRATLIPVASLEALLERLRTQNRP